MLVRFRSAVLVVSWCALAGPAFAGTTGGLRGRVLDANGAFASLSLAPDTYVVSVWPDFDSFGNLREPARLTLDAQFSYRANAYIAFTLALTGIADRCFQRGYAWDSTSTCVYAQLPSNALAPSENFVAHPRPPLAYPYASWYDNA